MEQLESFSNYILQIGHKYGLYSVFDDFLEMVVCSLSLGANCPFLLGHHFVSQYHSI